MKPRNPQETHKLKGVADSIEAGEYARAAKKLLGAFSWSDSPEGDTFWARIHARLEHAAARNLPPPKPI